MGWERLGGLRPPWGVPGCRGFRAMPPAGALLRLALLLLGAPPGTRSNPAEKPPQQVNGRLGGSISLPLKLPPAKTVNKIDWSLRTGSRPELQIAELRDGQLEQPNSNLGQRLEMADETTLRIRALEVEDSGVLKARILFDTLEVHEQSFNLSVFEPLPDPQIRAQLTSKTAEGCNTVTLQCLASEKGGFNISWKRGNHLCVLEEGSGCDWGSAEGTDLHLSWGPDSSDSTFTCLLSNPVDQKNVSFDLLSVCQREGDPRMKWLPAVVVSILAATGLGVCLRKKRSSQGAVSLTTPEEDTDVGKRKSPPEGDENQDPEPLSPCLAEIPTVTTPVTIYATLQPPPAT